MESFNFGENEKVEYDNGFHKVITCDSIPNPNGYKFRASVVKTKADAVVIIAIERDTRKIKPDEFILVKQYRYGAGKELLEAPAGLIDEGETPMEAAKRELLEETGYTAGRYGWLNLGAVYSSPGASSEKIHMFMACGVTESGEQKLDSGEQIEIVKLTYADFIEHLENKEIESMHTLAALFQALRYKDVIIF